MTSADEPRGAPGRRHWPEGSEPEPQERIELRCPGCSIEWWVHVDLAGYRLRCECGAWIDVPPDPRRPQSLALPAEAQLLGGGPPGARRSDSSVALSRDAAGGEVFPVGFHDQDVPTSSPVPHETLRHAPLETRRRWIDRSILELAAMACAFWGPALAIWMFAEGRNQALFLPIADLAAGILVLLVGFTARHFAFEGLRGCAARYWVEATLVALAAAALALGWVELVTRTVEGVDDDWLAVVREELGLAWCLFVIGVCPALFEELAFRGLVQGRLTALLGTRVSIVTTGIAFAFAHGITLGFPFHAFLGIHLCWLRVRSGSLYPCMLLHFVYNSLIVLLL